MSDAVDWDALAPDYAVHRQGYPPEFYAFLREQGCLEPGALAVDLGCGTGDVARGLGRAGMRVLGLDPAAALLRTAPGLPGGDRVHWARAGGEALPLADSGCDLLVYPSSFAWMDAEATLREARRVLAPKGRVVIAHWVWLDRVDGAGAISAALLAESGRWRQHERAGLLPSWIERLERSGFRIEGRLQEEVTMRYTLEGWCGRIRASVPVLGRMTAPVLAAFDAEHRRRLHTAYGDEPFAVPHLLYGVVAS